VGAKVDPWNLEKREDVLGRVKNVLRKAEKEDVRVSGSLGDVRRVSGSLGDVRGRPRVGDAKRVSGSLGDAKRVSGSLGDAKRVSGSLGDAKRVSGSLGDAKRVSGSLGDVRGRPRVGDARRVSGSLGDVRGRPRVGDARRVLRRPRPRVGDARRVQSLEKWHLEDVLDKTPRNTHPDLVLPTRPTSVAGKKWRVMMGTCIDRHLTLTRFSPGKRYENSFVNKECGLYY